MKPETIPFGKPATIPFGQKPKADPRALDGFANASDPNYFQRVGQQFKEGAESVISGIKEGASQLEQGNPLGGIRAGLRTAGAVAETAFSPILEAPLIKPLTEKVAEKVLSNEKISGVVSQATDFAKKNPTAAKDIQNIIDIATLGYGKTAEAPLSKELKLIGKDISQATKVALTPSEASVQNKVVELFNKSIKPTAKKTLGQGEKYENDVLSALKTIKANADQLNIEDATGEIITGRTPQTINELAQGLDQTKKLVFNQYDNLAKQAGTQGAVIDAKPIADEVAKVAENKALQLTNPDIIKYAEDWSTRLRGLDALDTQTTQEVIRLMNDNLSAFYRNPTYDTASKVAVDAGIANNFRKALDNAIENATGEQYQILKNQYSSLKAIENDVVRASMRDARKNAKGLLDYTDIFTGGQMITGILQLSPAMFTKGALERGVKEYIKFLNDPNRAISNIFEKLNIDTTKTFNPQSATGQFIQNPKLGLSIEDVSKTAGKLDDNLIQEAKKYKSAEEFVKAQGTSVYRGGDTAIDVTRGSGKGISVSNKETAGLFIPPKGGVVDEAILPKTAKILKEGDIPKNLQDAYKKEAEVLANPNNFSTTLQKSVIEKQQAIIDYARKNGFDAVEFPFEQEVRVIKPNVLKTKSQLTDIWNKANGKGLPPKVSPSVNIK